MVALASATAWPLAFAQAQQANPPSPDSQQTVVDLGRDGLDITVRPQAPSLTVPTVAAQRRDLNRIAGSVGFVAAESYKNTYANTLRDVLANAPGVYVQTRYSQEMRLSVRGAGITRSFHTRGLEILQDGIPTNLADGSGDYYQIDPLALQAAEILKGGNGLAFGASTLGGAVNFVSPTARTVASPNEVRLEGGSFGTGRLHVQSSKVLGDWDYFLSGTLTHADGWRSHEQQRSGQFNGNLGYRLSPDVETRFYLGAYIFAQKLPGTLSFDDALHRPRRAAAAALAGDQARDSETYRLANRTTVKLEIGKIDIDSWYIHKDLYHPIFQALDQRGATYGLAPRYSGQFEIGGLRNELLVGARLWAGDNRALQFLNVGGRRGAQTLNSMQKARNYEVFAENRLFFLPDVALMTGVKLLQSERDYRDRGGLPLNPTAKSASKTYRAVNPKFGLLWQPRKDIQVFADITRSTDVPDFTDLNQTIGATSRFVPLKLQRAWTAEIGSRGKYERFTWDVTLYRSMVRDELLNYTVDPSIPAGTFNAPRTVHQGAEFGGSVELLRDVTGIGDTLTLSQLYNFSDFRFRDDAQYGNNRIAGVPRHVLRSMLTYRHPDGYYLTPTVDWVPEGAYVDFANTKKVPGYALLGLRAGVDFSNGLSLYLDARNLTDKRYISDLATVTRYTPAYASFYPGTGRSVFGGMRYRF
jgi:iron complex outermembrane receptor protein